MRAPSGCSAVVAGSADSADLSVAQRRVNLAGSFVVDLRGAAVAGRQLVVVDDVVTSGATLTEAAASTGAGGARRPGRGRRGGGGDPETVVRTLTCENAATRLGGGSETARPTVGTRREGLASKRLQPVLPGGLMEIVVRGRNVEVPEHYRQHVEDKVGQIDRFDGKLKILRVDVELFHEKNPRQSAHCQRVEITLRGKGPVVRAEADGADFYAALDLAAHEAGQPPAPRGRPSPRAPRPPHAGQRPDGRQHHRAVEDTLDLDRRLADGPYVTDLDEHLPGRVVREKQHPATPMTVDQALHEMELVGHDFYLFQCADTGQPTVVYRRHAYDYGLIRLTDVPLNGDAAHAPKHAADAVAAHT